MKKLLLITVLFLSVVALTAVMPSSSDAYRVYGPGWGYYGYSYPAHGYVYGWGPGYTYWPGRVYYKVGRYPPRFRGYGGVYYGGFYY